jgi:hypothetical protein
MAKAATTSERIDLIFRRATSRPAAAAEQSVLFDLYRRQLRVFQKDPEAATKLLSVGESKSNERIDAIEFAALTTVASVVLNMDETITKE